MSEEALEPLKAIREKLIANRSLYFAVKETNVKTAERVFEQGRLTDGSEVRYDQDYEVYAYTPPSPRKVSGKGKPYQLWKNPPANAKGKARSIKGGWYQSYLDYKDAMDRKDTPFELTGRLRKAYLSDASLLEKGELTVQVVLTGENAQKYEGLTAKKGEFLQPSEAEIEYFRERLSSLL